MEINKSYYAILPANVRYDKRLTPNAKLLYAEITALCNEKGFCWATNKYFADLYSVSTVSVSKWIAQLCEFKYLTSEIIFKEGTKEILKRYLRIVKYPTQEKFNTPTKEKFKDNNTVINNTINNKEEHKPPTPKGESSINFNFDKLLDLINAKTGRNFKVLNDSVKRKYKARLKDGYTKYDIAAAVKNAVNNDYHKETGFKYLTPEFFSRSSTLDKYSDVSDSKPGVNPNETEEEKQLRIRREFAKTIRVH